MGLCPEMLLLVVVVILLVGLLTLLWSSPMTAISLPPSRLLPSAMLPLGQLPSAVGMRVRGYKHHACCSGEVTMGTAAAWGSGMGAS